MRLPFILLALPLCALGSEKAIVLDATWDRFSQHTALRYTHLGTQTRLDTATDDKPTPYLLVDTAQGQRITVYRHNNSWRLDPLEPKPRNDSPGGAPGIPPLPQPPPGIGPQGQIGPRTGSGVGAPPTPGYSAPAAGYGSAIPQSTISKTLPQVERDPQSPAPGPIGPQGPIGPRTGPGVAATTRSAAPAMPAMPEMPQMPDLPQPPAGIGPQAGMGPGAMPATAGFGPGPGNGSGGSMPTFMPPDMGGREPAPTLTKTEETQTILGRTAVKYTIASRRMETVEIWAVPDTDLGVFFTYRTQPPHRYGPIELQEQWDSLLRREHLFPLLAVFKQGDREIARFAVTKIDQSEVAEPAALFAPPAKFHRCPPDPF